MNFRRFSLPLLLFAVVWFGAGPASAQLKVEMKINRRLFILHEPIIAIVEVTNLAGRDITLHDADHQPWFGFQVMTADQRPVPPLDPDYALEPMTIHAGQTLKRSVDITNLYQMSEFGLYRVRASIYLADLEKYFSSAVDNVEMSEGKLIWQQTLGVPDGSQGAGSYRVASLLTFRLPRDNELYVRIQDQDTGTVFCTHKIARLLSGYDPEVEVDESNRLHVLQLVGPRTYVYTRIGLAGEWIGQQVINETKTRPSLHRSETGVVTVRGGEVQQPAGSTPNPLAPVPAKLSDRPPGMPKS